MKKHAVAVTLVLAAAATAFGAGGADVGKGAKGTVTVASKIDTEGALLGNMIRLVLEADGFKVNDRVQLGATNVVRQAILAGEIDIYPEYTGNAAMAYGTDGQLAAFGLVVLADDKGVQPVYEPAPLVRTAVLDKHPQIRTLLASVFAALDLVTLQTLNGAIAVDDRNAAEVVGTWLKSKGFLK